MAQVAKNNQNLLKTPSFWGKVMFFAAMFGGYAKYNMSTRDHSKPDL